MKKVPTFKVDDKVFAKVKGYPAWPARIVEQKGVKYNVQFYGTLETAVIKPKDIYYYLQHRHTFVKTLKRKDYNDAIEEIEEAIKEAGGSDGGSTESITDSINNVTSTATPKAENARNKRKRSMSVDGSSSKKQGEESVIPESGQKEKNKRNAGESLPKKLRTTRFTSTSEDDISTDESENLQAIDELEKILEVPHINDSEDKGILGDPAVTARDIKIVTEEYLTAIIAYAEFVKKEPKVFKRRAIEPRQTFKNETVLTKLPSGSFIGIKFNRDPIPPLNNEYDRAIYDETEAKTVLSLKKLLEEGKCDPETDKTLFIMNICITEAEIKEIVSLELIEHKQSKINMLKIESSLIECDAKIKRCLTLDRAQTKPALQLLERLLHLDLQPLMLKKHPHIVDMVRRLRHYIGNASAWNFTNEQFEEFMAAAGEIRNKADDVFYKFAELFNMPNETVFWEVFNDEVDSFKDQVNGLSESMVFSLTSEPNCRQSFLNRIEDDDEMKIIISSMEKTRPDAENGSID
ncbi:hypothetical protein RI129_003033 [Pyrocoelia pectoralis]|uniref:PWWP domain-containing protein n=1 Tax=Pyrocoelia pectoralis TaxID=417401 RepID=A0AAN7ZU14_9COLE